MLVAGQPSGANTIVADPLAVPNDEPTDVEPGAWPRSVAPRGSAGLSWADVVEDDVEAVASVTKADEASVEEISSDEPTEQQQAEASVQQQEQEALVKKQQEAYEATPPLAVARSYNLSHHPMLPLLVTTLSYRAARSTQHQFAAAKRQRVYLCDAHSLPFK